MRRGKHELVGYVDEPTTNGFAEAIIDEVEVINRFVASTSMHAT
jgi:transposase